MTADRQWPSTVEEALILLKRLLPEERLTELASLPAEALAERHVDLGAFVREVFGLWAGNEALLRNCAHAPGAAPLHPDDASMAIIRRLWRELKDTRTGGRFH